MKTILNRKKYDTKTATEIASISEGNGWRDFRYYEETLYRKKNGEFFLAGEGGPRSKYAVSIGNNSWSDGSKIIPLSLEAAQEWVEENCDSDTYEELFGPVEE